MNTQTFQEIHHTWGVPTYLLGAYDSKGEFGTTSSFKNIDKAQAAFQDMIATYSKRHIELIEEVRVTKVINSHQPKTTAKTTTNEPAWKSWDWPTYTPFESIKKLKTNE